MNEDYITRPQPRWWQVLALQVFVILACVAVGIAWYYVATGTAPW